MVVNERDEIGSDLVPDYMTPVQDGAFYGRPYSYFGEIIDDRVEPQKDELVKASAGLHRDCGRIRLLTPEVIGCSVARSSMRSCIRSHSGRKWSCTIGPGRNGLGIEHAPDRCLSGHSFGRA